jgi:predicted small metal-binding protein
VEEVLEKVADHARNFHQMKGFSKKDFDKARAAIHDGDCEPEGCCTDACCC